MTGADFGRSLRERCSTLLCLGLVVLGSIGLTSQSDAQTAAGNSTLGYSNPGAGWKFGVPSYGDSGDNYSDSGYNPLSVTATVWLGDPVTARYGELMIYQPIVILPFTGDPPDCTFDVSMTADAVTGSSYQGASAWAYHQVPDGNNPGINSQGPTVYINYVVDTKHAAYVDHVKVESDVTWTDTGFVNAMAWEIGTAGPGGPGGGSCSYKLAPRIKKAVHKTHLPTRHTTL